jgi:hypothetical protein
MPPAGEAAVRKFFEEYGVPVHSLEEYASMPDASRGAGSDDEP